MIKQWLAGLPFAALFVAAGISHFRQAAKFIGIMRGMPLPDWHPAANYITGAAELWLGFELAFAPLLGARHAAGICLALFWLVVLMTPANINMWYNNVPFGSGYLTYGWTGTHAMRMSLQMILLLCLYGLHLWWQAEADRKEK